MESNEKEAGASKDDAVLDETSVEKEGEGSTRKKQRIDDASKNDEMDIDEEGDSTAPSSADPKAKRKMKKTPATSKRKRSKHDSKASASKVSKKPAMSATAKRRFEERLQDVLRKRLNEWKVKMQKGKENEAEEVKKKVQKRAEELELAADNPLTMDLLNITHSLVGIAQDPSNNTAISLVKMLSKIDEDFDFENMTEEQKEIAQKVRGEFNQSLNVALGRTELGDTADVEFGDLFVQEAFKAGFGWKLKNRKVPIVINKKKGKKKKTNKKAASGSGKDEEAKDKDDEDEEAKDKDDEDEEAKDNDDSAAGGDTAAGGSGNDEEEDSKILEEYGLCGFQADYIIRTTKMSKLSNIEGKNHADTRVERASLLNGTSVVLVHFLIRKRLQKERQKAEKQAKKNKKGKKGKKKNKKGKKEDVFPRIRTEKPPDRNLALLITGFYDPTLSSLKNNKSEIGKPWFELNKQLDERGHAYKHGRLDVENFPPFEVIESRVNCMIDYLIARKTGNGVKQDTAALRWQDAIVWVESGLQSVLAPINKEVNTPPPKDSDEPEDEGSAKDADDDESVEVPEPVTRDDKEDNRPDMPSKQETEKITPDIAKAEDMRAVNVDDLAKTIPEGGHDDGAINHFKNHFDNGLHLCGSAVADETPPKLLPRVVPHRFENMNVPGRDGRTPEVLECYNVLHPDVLKAFIQIYFKEWLAFCRVTGGKFHRCFVTDDAGVTAKIKDETGTWDAKACFQMGQDKSSRFFLAFLPHKLEKQLTSVVESHTRAAVKAKMGADWDLFFNQCLVNLSPMARGAGFGRHQDSNLTNIRIEGDDNDYKDPKTNAKLPTKDTMVVTTLVLVIPDDQLLSPEPNYTLEWFSNDTSNRIAKAETASNYMHIQFFVQGLSKHGGSPMMSAVKSDNAHRITMSWRGYCNPAVNVEAWRKRLAFMKEFYDPPRTPLIGAEWDKQVKLGPCNIVLNPMKAGFRARAKAGERTIQDQNKEREQKARKAQKKKATDPTSLMHPSNADSYNNCADGLISNPEKLVSLVPIMKFRQTIAELYMSWHFQYLLLKRNIVLRVLLYNHNRKDVLGDKPLVIQSVPLIRDEGELKIPTNRYVMPKTAMLALAHLKWTDQAKPIVSTAHQLATSLCLSCKLRLHNPSAKKVLEIGKGYKRTDKRQLKVYGSGGAPVTTGSAGANVSGGYMPEIDAAALDSSPQALDGINAILAKWAQHNHLINVWMSRDLVIDLNPKETRSMEEDESMFVGLFFVCKLEILPPATDEQLQEDYPFLNGTDDLNKYPHLGFRACPHICLTLEMIAEDEHDRFVTKCKKKKLHLLTITDAVDERATFEVPMSTDGKRNVNHQIGFGLTHKNTLYHQHMMFHIEQHIKKIYQKLPGLHKIDDIPELLPNERKDSEAWHEYRESLQAQDPYGPSHMLTKRIFRHELMGLAQAMGFVALVRALSMCVDDATNTIMPLVWDALGTVLMKFTFPSPIRPYDPPVLLAFKMVSVPVDPKKQNCDQRNLAEDLFVVFECHLFGRARGLGHYVNSLPVEEQDECMRRSKVDRFAKHIMEVDKKEKGAMFSFVVKQYEKQIPKELRRNAETATTLLRQLADSADYIAKTVLQPGKPRRKQYVEDLATEMAKMVVGTSQSEHLFVAQHIIATLAEMYPDDRFGEVGVEDVYMGPGSRSAVAILGFKKSRPQRDDNKSFVAMSDFLSPDEAKFLLDGLMDLEPDALTSMGLYRDSKLETRVRLSGRKLNLLDLEHLLCKLYLFMKRKSPPGMSATEPKWHSFYCHPMRYNNERLAPENLQMSDGTKPMKQYAQEAIDAFEKSKFVMPWKFLLKAEWPTTTPWTEAGCSTVEPHLERAYKVEEVEKEPPQPYVVDEDHVWDAFESEEMGNVYYYEYDNEPDLIDEKEYGMYNSGDQKKIDITKWKSIEEEERERREREEQEESEESDSSGNDEDSEYSQDGSGSEANEDDSLGSVLEDDDDEDLEGW